MRRIAAVLTAAGILAGATAHAAGEPLEWWPDLPELTETDRTLAKTTGRVDMTGKPVGTVLAWQNPESGNSGTVELTEYLKWQGNDCRRLIHEFRVVGKRAERVEFVTCRMADGSWKWPVPPKRL